MEVQLEVYYAGPGSEEKFCIGRLCPISGRRHDGWWGKMVHPLSRHRPHPGKVLDAISDGVAGLAQLNQIIWADKGKHLDIISVSFALERKWLSKYLKNKRVCWNGDDIERALLRRH
jgi:hypothetical protein